MKILQIAASYKPAYIYGGPIMSVSMLAEQLVMAGESVQVLTTTANGIDELPVKIAQPVMIDAVSVIYFARLTKDHTQFSPALLIHLWKKSKDFDVIHIQAWWNLVAVLSCLIAVWRRVPVVMSPRGTLSSYSFKNKNNKVKKLIHQLLTRPLLKRCFIHTTSENEQLALTGIILAKKVFNIPNFIRLAENSEFPEPSSKDYLKIIFLSRIEEKKGLDILLNALPMVSVPYKLSIAGDGNAEYVNHLKDIAGKNNIDKNIEWLGFRGKDKFQLLHDHDLMVLTSYDENFGNVVIESLSVGTAVLISENVGLADYITENQLGWRCQTNPESVAEAINGIYIQSADLNRIRKQAPDKISKDFDANNLVKKYIDMYNQIVAK